MNNWNWTEPETADAAALTWDEYRAKWGAQTNRTYTAYRLKRADVLAARSAGGPVLKAAPVNDDPAAVRDPALVRLMEIEDDNELFRAYVAMHRQVQKQFPPQRDLQVGIDVEEPCAIALMADWHVGGEGTNIERLEADIETIANHPRIYCQLGGDVCDNFILRGMSDAAQSSDAQVKVQWRIFRKLIRPLMESKSILWTSSGNHDAWSQKAAQIDRVLAALAEVQVSYLGEGDRPGYTGEGAFVDLRVGPADGRHEKYVFWRKHRPVRFNSAFNRTHVHKQLLRMLLPREWEIGITEHLHTPAIEEFWYRQRPRFAVACGSYKEEDAWGREWGFIDGGYGVPCAVVAPGRHEFVVVSSLRRAMEFLDGPSLHLVVRPDLPPDAAGPAAAAPVPVGPPARSGTTARRSASVQPRAPRPSRARATQSRVAVGV